MDELELEETREARIAEITRREPPAEFSPRPNVASSIARRATVIIAHRHRLYLDGLVRLLDTIESVQLVGCAETEEQLLDCVKRARPETVIFEPFAPLPGGLAILGRIQEASSATKAFVILQNDDVALLMTALRNGAWGFFSHDANSQDIARAIQAARRGELWVERGVMRRLLLGRSRFVASTTDEVLPDRFRAAARGELSQREQQVAAQVVAGLCNKRIATNLSITESTVKAHLVHIFRKLDVENRTQLARCLDDALSAG